MKLGAWLFLLLACGIPAAGSAGGAEVGKVVYEGTCVACHGSNGKGVVPGTPDFTDSSGSLNKSDDELIANILNGFQSPGSMLAMPPGGGNPALTEDDAAKVVEYIRERFGEH